MMVCIYFIYALILKHIKSMNSVDRNKVNDLLDPF